MKGGAWEETVNDDDMQRKDVTKGGAKMTMVMIMNYTINTT